MEQGATHHATTRLQGKLLKMLKTMEQSLLLRRDTLGSTDPDVQARSNKP